MIWPWKQLCKCETETIKSVKRFMPESKLFPNVLLTPDKVLQNLGLGSGVTLFEAKV